MAGEIEKMNRMRGILLWSLFVGTAVAFIVLMTPTITGVVRLVFGKAPIRSWKWSMTFWEIALLLWLAVLLVFAAVYILYKRKLRRDPGLKGAVNDERVRLNWLRSYRFAFFVMMAVAVFSKLWDILASRFLGIRGYVGVMLPDIPWLIGIGGAVSLLGAFLILNRGPRGE